MRQGGTESPYLFTLYVDEAMRQWSQKCREEGIEGLRWDYQVPSSATNRQQRGRAKARGNCELRWLGYADDIVVLQSQITSSRGLWRS